jgi:hypothetical protein
VTVNSVIAQSDSVPWLIRYGGQRRGGKQWPSIGPLQAMRVRLLP